MKANICSLFNPGVSWFDLETASNAPMDVARLILDYLQTLIWPALLIAVLIRFAPHLRALFQRVSTGGQLQVGGAGFNLLLDFRNTLHEIAEQSENLDEQALRKSVKQADERLNRELLALTSAFYESPIEERRKIAAKMRKQTATMSLDELLELADSDDPGERVAAGIGLGDRMKRSSSTQQDPRVLSALRALLDDRSHSRVRYRAAEALNGSPELVPRFRNELYSLAKNDSNGYVKRMAQRALDKAPH
jgi:hypothetical protein